LRFFFWEVTTGAFFAVPDAGALVAYVFVAAGVLEAVEGFFEAALGGI
jgi:hypothetical protein